MAGLHSRKPDGTEGTATAKMTYKEGKNKLLTLTMYGCIVKNDANLQRFLGNHIKQSADMKKFKNNEYFFYTCDPDFEEERNYLKVTVAYDRFSKPSQPKSCRLDMSPDVFVKVQDQHIFLVCDSPEFNKSTFLKSHSKEIRVAQYNLTESVYGLSCEEEEEEEEYYPKFIKLTLNHQLSNVYHVISKYPKTLQDAGPVLLDDKKTVVGSYEIKDNKSMSISVFGSMNQDSKRELYSSGSCQEVEGKSEWQSDQKPRSHQEDLTEKELSEEKNEKLAQQDTELVEGNQECTDPKLCINESWTEEKKSTPQSSSQSEIIAAEDQNSNLKLDRDLKDMKNEEGKTAQKIPVEKYDSQPETENGTSKQGQEHEYQFPSREDQTDSKDELADLNLCNPKQQAEALSGSFQCTTEVTFEGIIHQQATTQDETFASQDQSKLTVNMNKGASEEQSKLILNKEKENDTLTLQLNQHQSNCFGEKSPIQETSESSKDFDPLQEIKATLPDGPHQIYDDLGLKKNQERYRRFLLHVARNDTGKWREIGERLEIKVNKLESLKADYKHEGSAEQAYQMLVHWRESDKPTLEKLLFALNDTGLKQVAEQISGTDMLIDRRNRGGKAVTEQLLNKITNDVKDIWKFLGRYLTIDENDIYSIKMDNDGSTREQAHQMLVKWRQSNGKSATTGILVNALRDVGKTNVADYVRVWERQQQLS